MLDIFVYYYKFDPPPELSGWLSWLERQSHICFHDDISVDREFDPRPGHSFFHFLIHPTHQIHHSSILRVLFCLSSLS